MSNSKPVSWARVDRREECGARHGKLAGPGQGGRRGWNDTPTEAARLLAPGSETRVGAAAAEIVLSGAAGGGPTYPADARGRGPRAAQRGLLRADHEDVVWLVSSSESAGRGWS